MTHEKAFVWQTGMEPVLQATWSCWSAPWGTSDRKTCCWTANALHCGPCERLHHLFFGLQIHKVLRIPALPQELRWNPAVFWRHNFDIAKPRNGITAKNVIVTHWHTATILQPYWNHIETHQSATTYHWNSREVPLLFFPAHLFLYSSLVGDFTPSEKYESIGMTIYSQYIG